MSEPWKRVQSTRPTCARPSVAAVSLGTPTNVRAIRISTNGVFPALIFGRALVDVWRRVAPKNNFQIRYGEASGKDTWKLQRFLWKGSGNLFALLPQKRSNAVMILQFSQWRARVQVKTSSVNLTNLRMPGRPRCIPWHTGKRRSHPCSYKRRFHCSHFRTRTRRCLNEKRGTDTNSVSVTSSSTQTRLGDTHSCAPTAVSCC